MPCEFCKRTNGHHTFCPAVEEIRKAAERFGPIREGVAECGLPARYATNEASLDTYDTSGHKSLLRAWEAASRWSVGEGPSWIFLFSAEPGLGKTHLAASALAAKIRAGKSGRFAKFGTMQREFVSCGFGEKERVFRKFAVTPNLVLDEVGTEKTSEYGITILFEVIDERYERELPTWINSNLSIGELAEKYAETDDARAAKRIISRIYERTGGNESAGRYELRGRSWRNR